MRKSTVLRMDWYIERERVVWGLAIQRSTYAEDILISCKTHSVEKYATVSIFNQLNSSLFRCVRIAIQQFSYINRNSFTLNTSWAIAYCTCYNEMNIQSMNEMCLMNNLKWARIRFLCENNQFLVAWFPFIYRSLALSQSHILSTYANFMNLIRIRANKRAHTHARPFTCPMN